MARLVRAAVVAVALGCMCAPGASAATFLVDDNKVQCPNAGFTSLAAAVDAADVAPGSDTVVVCRGTYQAISVSIDSPLELRGAGADLVRIEAPSPTTDYILTARGPGPVDISGVTLASGNRSVAGAVRFEGVSGSLRRSRITDLAQTVTPGEGIGVLVDDGSGSPAFTLQGSLLEGYGQTGLVVDGVNASATVQQSVIRGRGPLSSPSQAQDGIRIANLAKATVTGNLIADNRNTTDEVDGAAVRLVNGSDQTLVNTNDLQGNGYGVFRGDATGRCDESANPANAINATGNWWGHPSGPTLEPRPLCAPPIVPPPTRGDRINTGVDASSRATAPRGAPTAPAPQPDARPDVAITSPADNTEASPGSPVTVTATATDDFDVAKVEFRRGATLVKSDVQPPYDAAVNAPAAGQSQAILVTAFDSSGQTDAAAISLRGTPAPVQQPPSPPPPQTPQQVVEDQPPGVAFTGPSEGAAINPSAPPLLTADASDDRGVARVAFLDDGKVVCTDESAPYDCAYAPTGDDVGRNTLIAIAVDGAGQTAVAFRAVSVARFDPRLTAATTPKRDRKRPYRFTTSGSVLLPTGVTPAQACAAGGSVTIEFRAGKLRLPQTAPLRADCSYRASIAFPNRRSLGRGRLSVTTKFSGNSVLGTARARTHRVQAG